MNRLEKLKLETANYHRDNSVDSGMSEETAMYYGCLHGFDAASAEYEKIIAELEGGLDNRTRSRNNYAMALRVALQNSIFPNKKYVNDEINKILIDEVERV